LSTRPPDGSTASNSVAISAATPLPRPPLEVASAASPLSLTATILLAVATIAALYLGRDVLIPLALAILLSFALGPPVTWLYRRGLPRVPAVLAVMFLVTLLLGGFAALVASQLTHLAQQMPTYEANLRAKAKEVAEAAPSGGLVNRAADLMRDVNREIDKITAGKDAPAATGTPTLAAQQDSRRTPIPVEIHEPPSPPLQALAAFVGPLVQPIATAGIVLVFIVFVLLQREDLRDRVIRLFGMNDVHRATAAISDAAKRIGRYLLMQLVVNLLYGIPVAIGLYLIGVPNALLWGLLATIFRFVPYLGPILAAVCPIALSLAVDPSWTTPLLTVALFVVLELFTNNVLEPWLYGASTGLSPLALIVAAVFWTTLWGPVGLLLATPLTVCLVVLGRHVPQLQIFEVLLGDTPVLEPDVKFYQRLLAADPHDAEELADDMLEERPLADVFDRVVLPALAYADQDRQRGALPPMRAREIAGWVQEIVDSLAEAADVAAERAAERPAASLRVLCVGARGGADVAAAAMVAHLLRRNGVAAEVSDAGTVLRASGQVGGFDAVCVSYVDPEALRQARRLINRLRARLAGDTTVCLGLYGLAPSEIESARAATHADIVVASLGQAVKKLTGLGMTADDAKVATSSI
jgi:predicted PurR-regulated permease PerM